MNTSKLTSLSRSAAFAVLLAATSFNASVTRADALMGEVLYQKYKSQTAPAQLGSMGMVQLRARGVQNNVTMSVELSERAADGMRPSREALKTEAELAMQFESTRTGAFSPIPLEYLENSAAMLEWVPTLLGPLNIAAGPILNAGIKVAGKEMASSIQQLKTELNKMAEKELIIELKNRQAQSDASITNLAGMSPEAIYGALFPHDSNSGLDPEKLPDTAGPLVVNARLTAIRNNFTQYVVAMKEGQLNVEGDLAETQQNLSGLAQTFSEFGKLNLTQMKEINQGQAAIANGVGELLKEGSENQQSLSFMKEFMFGKMSPEEQLVALKQGALFELGTAKQAELQKQIELVVKRQELTQKIGNYLDNSGQLIAIAQRLKVAPNVVKALSKAHQIGSSGFSAVNAIASGNYIGAASAVLDMFGIGAPDPADARHQEIMGTLNEIQGDLKEIKGDLAVIKSALESVLKGIDEIKQGQALIVENQQKIFNQILDLQENVNKNFAMTMGKLDAIHTDVLVNREAIMDVAEAGLNHCGVLLEGRKDFSSFNDKEFLNNAELFTFLQDYKQNLEQCFIGLDGMVPSSLTPEFRKSLLWSSWKGEGAQAYDLEKDVYLPMLSLLRDQYKTFDSRTLLKLVSTPTSSYANFSEKMAEFQKSPQGPSSSSDRFFPVGENFMSQLLSPSRVKRYIELALALHSYREVMNCSLASVSDGSCTPSSRAKKMLESFLPILNTAIAQQRLLDGDFVAFSLRNKVANEVPPLAPVNPIEKRRWMWAFQHSPVLRHNFVMTLVRDSLASTNSSVFGYGFLTELDDGAMINKYLNSTNQFTLVKSPENHRWAIQLEDTENRTTLSLELPAAEQVPNAALILGENSLELLQLKGQLVEAIMSYDVPKLYASKGKNALSRYLDIVFLGTDANPLPVVE